MGPGSAPSARPRSGLDDVVAVRTRLSHVDGETGELVLAGRRVEALAFGQGFEAVCLLLWRGALPEEAERARFAEAVGRRRVALHERIVAGALVPSASPPPADPMDALRALLARLEATGDPMEDSMTLLAGVPVANAWWWWGRRGAAAPAPEPERTTAADYLRTLTGREPTEAAVRGLERYLVTVSDHGMNASTFTARVIASTRSDMVSAVVGAVGALKGPLHGGAPGPVLDMLDAIGAPESAEAWLRRELEAGRRIMGMGHRVYRVRDPRAAVFERALAEMEGGGGSERLRLARAVERTAEAVLAERYPERRLKANVEFYTAVLLEAVGVPRELFAATFALGRTAGWCAHFMEQREEDRLIRPRSAYVGPEPV